MFKLPTFKFPAKYRIRKVTKGIAVWFTAEHRVALFLWLNCEYTEKFRDVESAKRAIEQHKNRNARPKKELVIKL
jgi:hypothetical protein